MTREEKLYSMKMVDLAKVADKLGIKINKKAAKSEAVEKILAAEKANDDAYVAEVMQQKADLNIECPTIDSVEIVDEEICEDGTPYAEIGKEIAEQARQKANAPAIFTPASKNLSMIDEVVLSKFVKKAQKLITQAIHDKNGYHITINVNNKEIFYHDKNLQNIRAAIGRIYRGELIV